MGTKPATPQSKQETETERMFWFRCQATNSQYQVHFENYDACLKVAALAEKFLQITTLEVLDELKAALDKRWEVYGYARPCFTEPCISDAYDPDK